MPNAGCLRTLGEANIFIAPRLYEGVAPAFLEALAQGCSVFGFDAPTMDEYIEPGEDVYLITPFMPSAKNKTFNLLWRGNAFMRRHLGRLGSDGGSRFSQPVATFQDGPAITALDLERLGTAARLRHQVGCAEWENSIPDYIQFVLEWQG